MPVFTEIWILFISTLHLNSVLIIIKSSLCWGCLRQSIWKYVRCLGQWKCQHVTSPFPLYPWHLDPLPPDTVPCSPVSRDSLPRELSWNQTGAQSADSNIQKSVFSCILMVCAVDKSYFDIHAGVLHTICRDLYRVSQFLWLGVRQAVEQIIKICSGWLIRYFCKKLKNWTWSR